MHWGHITAGNLLREKERLEAQVIERTAELAKINDALSLEVAEHKRAAAALRESEQRFRDYTETASGVVANGDAGLRWLNRDKPDLDQVRNSGQPCKGDVPGPSKVRKRGRR